MKKQLGLCKGRHEIPGVEEYIYPTEVNPLDLRGMRDQAHVALRACDTVDLYVTGLTVALMEVVNYCIRHNVGLTLWHYNRDTGKYYPQVVHTDMWAEHLREGEYIS